MAAGFHGGPEEGRKEEGDCDLQDKWGSLISLC